LYIICKKFTTKSPFEDEIINYKDIFTTKTNTQQFKSLSLVSFSHSSLLIELYLNLFCRVLSDGELDFDPSTTDKIFI